MASTLLKSARLLYSLQHDAKDLYLSTSTDSDRRIVPDMFYLDATKSLDVRVTDPDLKSYSTANGILPKCYLESESQEKERKRKYL